MYYLYKNIYFFRLLIIVNNTLQFNNNDLDQSLVNTSPDTFESFNSSIPTVEVQHL